MPTFDLLSEPWVPVIDRSGTPLQLNLADTVLNAHQLGEIRDTVPVFEFGLYRFLTALVQDIFRIEHPDDLADLLAGAAKGLAPDRVGAYFTEHRGRFDLFHPQRPFLQDASLANAERKPVALLHPAVPSGTNAVHFHHREEFDFAVAPAVATRLLLGTPAFMTMGGAGLSPSINGAPPWYVLVRRENLAETLLLGCSTLPRAMGRALGLPAWRNECGPATGPRADTSLLDALTWQPRRILLFPEEGGRCAYTGSTPDTLVRRMAFVAGAKPAFVWTDDPNVAYRGGDKGLLPLRPREGREVWRDVGALAFARESRGGESTYHRRPAAVTQFAHLARAGDLPGGGDLDLLVYGMRTDLKTKVFEWQREGLCVPARLAWGEFYHDRAQQALDEAEEIARLLRYALRKAYPRDGKSNKAGAFETLIGAAQRNYWARLRPAYDGFLRGLAAEPDEETLLRLRGQWERDVLGTGRQVLEEATEDLDADRAAIRRLTEARSRFRSQAYLQFHPEARKSSRARADRVGDASPAETSLHV
jgi:CRISPR system Cascade subunit CasA